MNKLRLPWLLAACTAGVGSVHAQQIPPLQPKAGAISSDLAPLADGPAIVKLTELYGLLTSKQTQTVRTQLAKRSVDSMRAAPVIDSPLDVGFVDAHRLENDKVRQETRALFDAGMPIAVFTSPMAQQSGQDSASKLFGAASHADLAIYAKKADGGMQIFAIDLGKSLHYPEEASRIQQFQQAVSDHMLSAAPFASSVEARSPRNRRSVSGHEGHSPHVPIMEVTTTKFHENKQALTANVTVVRDSTPSKDNFHVIVKSSGMIKGGDDLLPDRKCGLNGRCAFTSEYTTLTVLRYNKNPLPSVARVFPESTNQDNVEYNHNQSITTNYGYNLSPLEQDGLNGKVLAPSLKKSFGYTWGKHLTTTTPMDFTARDYSTRAFPMHDSFDGLTANYWRFPLSSNAINGYLFFGTNPLVMQRSSVQSYSRWTIDASRAKHPISIFTRGGVIQRTLRNEERKVYRLDTDLVTIDLDSPYLHREPVVLLQSKEREGRCLKNDGRGGVTLGNCNPAPENRAEQWYLDAADRYVSRLDGKCLTVHAFDESEVEVAACGSETTQKWYWSADRIQSRFHGSDHGWRLFVEDDAVKARIRPELQQIIPNNPNHPLLAPWSTYPNAPVSGATIPALSGREAPVPDDWVRRFENVPVAERWEPVALRQ